MKLRANILDQRQRAAAIGLSAAIGAIVLIALLLSLRLAAVAAPSATTWYVHPNGSDSGTGTPDLPFKTIQHAIDRAEDGDTILVAAGAYTENVSITKTLTLHGGHTVSGTTWLPRTGETIIDGSNSRTVEGDWDGVIHAAIVITDGGEFKMWYQGVHLYEQQGFGLATSSDGITWSKDAANPVFTATVEWEGDKLGHPCVITDSGVYKMWYGPDDERIGFAWSSDGISWTKYADNPIIRGAPGTWDESGVGAPFVIKVGPSDYRLWYQNKEQTGIGYATSTNGIDWTRHPTPVLSPGSGGSWDDAQVADPQVLYQGGVYHMWYAGNDGGGYQVGYAWSPDGMAWTKSLSNPVLTPGPPGSWDEGNVAMPNVLFDGALYRMWFTGWGGWGTNQRGYATSPDRIIWTKYAGNPVLTPGTPGQWGQPVVQFVTGSDGSALDDFTVRNGDAAEGGGVFIFASQVTVRNSVVTSNSAFYSGGGIFANLSSTITVTGNQILYNTVTAGGGGGMSVVSDSSADMHANTIAYNRGGGILIDNASVVTVTNNIVASNVGTAPAEGGDGIYMWGDTSQARLVNNTIAFNSGEGVQTLDNSTALVRNNIIVGNEGAGINDLEWRTAFTIDHNDVWDNGENYLNVTPGAGDISANPLFVDVANGDYHLQVGSPCIDKGTSVGAPMHDIEGTPRDAAPDMGAYEWTGFHIFLPLTLRSFGP